jgi:hypothetical protein
MPTHSTQQPQNVIPREWTTEEIARRLPGLPRDNAPTLSGKNLAAFLGVIRTSQTMIKEMIFNLSVLETTAGLSGIIIADRHSAVRVQLHDRGLTDARHYDASERKGALLDASTMEQFLTEQGNWIYDHLKVYNGKELVAPRQEVIHRTPRPGLQFLVANDFTCAVFHPDGIKTSIEFLRSGDYGTLKARLIGAFETLNYLEHTVRTPANVIAACEGDIKIKQAEEDRFARLASALKGRSPRPE